LVLLRPKSVHHAEESKLSTKREKVPRNRASLFRIFKLISLANKLTGTMYFWRLVAET
jgi:hypothetical protein